MTTINALEPGYYPIEGSIENNLRNGEKIKQDFINSITEYIRTGILSTVRQTLCSQTRAIPTKLSPLELSFSISVLPGKVRRIQIDSLTFEKPIEIPDDTAFGIQNLEMVASRVNVSLQKTLSDFQRLKGNQRLRFRIDSTPSYLKDNYHHAEDLKIVVWIHQGRSCVIL